MPKTPPTLHRVVFVLGQRDRSGKWNPYRERNCTYWFPSVAGFHNWIKRLQLDEGVSGKQLTGARKQLEELTKFKEQGLLGVVYDPKEPGAEMIPIDDLMFAIGAVQALEEAKSKKPREVSLSEKCEDCGKVAQQTVYVEQDLTMTKKGMGEKGYPLICGCGRTIRVPWSKFEGK
jgi:hypothetical protein